MYCYVVKWTVLDHLVVTLPIIWPNLGFLICIQNTKRRITLELIKISWSTFFWFISQILADLKKKSGAFPSSPIRFPCLCYDLSCFLSSRTLTLPTSFVWTRLSTPCTFRVNIKSDSVVSQLITGCQHGE